jgi:hypothetical protein
MQFSTTENETPKMPPFPLTMLPSRCTYRLRLGKLPSLHEVGLVSRI